MSIPYYANFKTLYTNADYKKLSNDAKTLYSIMRDRFNLSIKNGDKWKDERGTFILMARKSIAEFLNRSLPTVRKIIRELIAFGLIAEKRIGLTHFNHIYVQPLKDEAEGVLPSKGENAMPSSDKTGFIPEGKKVTPNNLTPNNGILNNDILGDAGAQKRVKNELKPGHNATKYAYDHEYGSQQQKRWQKGTVPAQQYTQREYTREQLYALFEEV
jgi:hypothetical protein